MSEYRGDVSDLGEGRWTIEAAIEEAVPANVLSASLYARFRSRVEHGIADKLLSAMRHGFGGHVEPGGGQMSMHELPEVAHPSATAGANPARW